MKKVKDVVTSLFTDLMITLPTDYIDVRCGVPFGVHCTVDKYGICCLVASFSGGWSGPDSFGLSRILDGSGAAVVSFRLSQDIYFVQDYFRVMSLTGEGIDFHVKEYRQWY